MKNNIWTQEEELKLLKEITNGQTLDNLALVHDRSSSALELRLKKIIYDNVSAGQTERAMAKLLNLPEDKIKQYFYEYKGFIEKKGGITIPQSTKETALGTITSLDNRTKQKENVFIIPKQNQNQSIVEIKQSNQSHPTGLTLTKPSPQLGGRSLTGNELRKHEEMNKELKKEKIEKKIKRIEEENKILKEIIENSVLRKQIDKMIKDGKIDHK